MNTEKASAVHKHKRSKRQKNKHSKYTVKDSSCTKDNENFSNDEEINETADKYMKREITNNWAKYDKTLDNDNSDITSSNVSTRVKSGKTNGDNVSDISSDYVPVEILSSQEINKQLKLLPDPKPPRSVAGYRMKKDTSAEDAAFWYDSLPASQRIVKPQYGKKNNKKCESKTNLEIEREEEAGPQRQPKSKPDVIKPPEQAKPQRRPKLKPDIVKPIEVKWEEKTEPQIQSMSKLNAAKSLQTTVKDRVNANANPETLQKSLDIKALTQKMESTSLHEVNSKYGSVSFVSAKQAEQINGQDLSTWRPNKQLEINNNDAKETVSKSSDPNVKITDKTGASAVSSPSFTTEELDLWLDDFLKD